MARTLVISFRLPADARTRGSEIHRIRNFGEDLYREFRDSRLAEVDLAEIDRATDKLAVRGIKNRKYHTVEEIVRKLLMRHHFDATAHVSEG